jgi:NADPH2:quinone reductase
MLKNIAVTGLHWGAFESKDPERIPIVYEALTELYTAGEIEPLVYASYALEDVPAALEALGSRKTYGKVIVTP